MPIRLRIHRYVALAALVVIGLLLLALPPTDWALGATRSCARSPNAGAIELVVVPGLVTAGQTAHFRIDNSTGPTITYGPYYNIQECVAGVWIVAPFSPTGGARVKEVQRPSRGRWQRVPIPATAADGEYRVRKSVQVNARGRWLYGDFDIVAPGT